MCFLSVKPRASSFMMGIGDRGAWYAAVNDRLPSARMDSAASTKIHFVQVLFTSHCLRRIQVVIRCLYFTSRASLSHPASQKQMHTPTLRLKLFAACVAADGILHTAWLHTCDLQRNVAHTLNSAVRHRTFLHGMIRSSKVPTCTRFH